MKFAVKILPREVILDTQGRAVEQVLKEQNLKISQCRVGRYVEIEVPLQNESEALQEVKKMAEFVLYNPLIETYQISRVLA